MKTQRAREDQKQTIDTSVLSIPEIRSLIPKKLYKYNAITPYFLQGLDNHSLWFSSPLDFNDPFDCKLNLRYGRTKSRIIENYSKLFVTGKADPNLNLDELLQNFLSKPDSFENILNLITKYVFGEKLGVCCFSERNDHILMWSHYAANHSGVCLQFNSAKHGLIHDNVLPVQYYSEYPSIKLSDYSAEQLKGFYYHAICAKSELWDYEYEWRAILGEGARMTHQYSMDDLTGIIFGVNTTNQDFEKIDQIVSRNGFPSLKYYKTEMNPRRYSLSVRKM